MRVCERKYTSARYVFICLNESLTQFAVFFKALTACLVSVGYPFARRSVSKVLGIEVFSIGSRLALTGLCSTWKVYR